MKEQETTLPPSLQDIVGTLAITNGYHASRMPISNQMAKALVSRRKNKFQRGIKTRIRAHVKGQLTTGQWVNDSVITLGYVAGEDDFYILNGQHRLTVLSELADVHMVVLLHILEFADSDQLMVYATTAVDANAQRSTADQFQIAGVMDKLPSEERSLIRYLPPANTLIWSRMKGTGGGADKPMPIQLKLSAFEDWRPHALQYIKTIDGCDNLKILLQKQFLAVGMVTFRCQPELAERFWKAVSEKQEGIEGFFEDVLHGNAREEIGPKPRDLQSLVRATAGAFNLFSTNQSVPNWETILDHLEECKVDQFDDWFDSPLLLYGSPYDGKKHLSYDPAIDGDRILNSQTQWSREMPSALNLKTAGAASPLSQSETKSG